jgi:hypothetical protein
LAVTTFLFGVLGVTIHTLFQAQRTTRTGIDARRTMARLSLQYREDAHAAVSVADDSPAAGASENQQTLVLGEGQLVRYKVKPDTNEMERTVLRDGAEVARQTFRLPRGTAVRFESTLDTPPRIMKLSVSRPVGDDAVDSRKLTTIDAALGLHTPRGGMSSDNAREEE